VSTSIVSVTDDKSSEDAASRINTTENCADATGRLAVERDGFDASEQQLAPQLPPPTRVGDMLKGRIT
jgi:hypothetical protein